MIIILQDCFFFPLFPNCCLQCFILVLPDNSLALYTQKSFGLFLILTDMINYTEQMIHLKDEKHNNNNSSMVIKLQYLTKRQF